MHKLYIKDNTLIREENQIRNMSHVPGCRFVPTDEELITFYLSRKVRGEELPQNKSVIERDVYSDAPWNVFAAEDQWVTLETADASGYKKFKSNIYAITELKKTSKSRAARIAGCGTWHGENKADSVRNGLNEVIGFKKRFVFEARGGSTVNVGGFQSGHWIMQEYTLSDSTQPYVLCKITWDGSKPLKRSRRHGDDQACDKQQSKKMKCSHSPPLEASTYSVPVMTRSCYGQPLLHRSEGIINTNTYSTTTPPPLMELPVEGRVFNIITYSTNPLPLKASASVPVTHCLCDACGVLQNGQIINASSYAALPLEYGSSVPMMPSSSHGQGIGDVASSSAAQLCEENWLQYVDFD